MVAMGQGMASMTAPLKQLLHLALESTPQAPRYRHGGHPVLRWMEGTALRPVKAALDEDAWRRFRAVLGEKLAAAYPVRHGLVPFAFRRVFLVAETA